MKQCSRCKLLCPLSEYGHNQRHTDKKQSQCKLCRRQMDQQYHKANRNHILQRKRIRHLQHKQEVFKRLGGAKCVLCGCQVIHFLTVDHTNRDGAKQRKQIGRSNQYSWILKSTDEQLAKANLRVLCFNCNGATAHYTDAEIIQAIKGDIWL